MKSGSTTLRALMCATVLALLASGIAFATEVNLTAVTFPDRTTIDVPMARTTATPAAAKFEASVKFENGQAKVEVSFKKMEPAILFGGDISSYVVWAVTRDGAVENLGELVVNETNGSGSNAYQTGKKQFALMVTAEPYYTVGKPGVLVVATSMGADPKKTDSSPFGFSAFRVLAVGPKVDNASIAGLTYKDKTPVALVQARRAMALAQSTGAAALNPQAMDQAKMALQQAENSAKSGGSAKVVTDYARRTITLTSQTMRDLGRKMDADEAAAKKAELDKNQMTIAQLREAQAKLEADKAKLLMDQAAIAKERDELAKLLRKSMDSIMDTRDSARGAVMSLPGISFETGKANLKVSGQLTLAKLAGIAQVFPDVNMRVEGYTDSTGKADMNQKLSADRAKAVYDFLISQGVPASRLAFQGMAASNPVADNATADGRAKNRRVEIIAAKGEIKAVSAN